MAFKPDEIRGWLETRITQYEFMAHPAMLERFVLRNGHVGYPRKRPSTIRKRRDKECFANSARLAFDSKGLTYVEGFATNPMHGLLIHHAWLEDKDHNVIDPTWREPETCLYYGVPFDFTTLYTELARHKVYGLLDHGLGYNTDLMFKLDPELRDIVDRVAAGPDRLKEMEAKRHG